MKRIYLSTVAILALGYSHGRTETVMATVKGVKGPVRVNKADFDADQEGDKTMSLAKTDDTDTATNTGTRSDVNVTHQGNDGEVQTTAAPSAPDFSSPDSARPLPMDETKQAAAPAITGAEQLLVMKSGKKFFITDGMGNKITGDRAKTLEIDEKGYDSEEAAKAVQSRTEPSKGV